jgi:hypothetical protein
MRLDELPADLRPLADPAQEVLLERDPEVRQLAPVPLRHVEPDPLSDPYRPDVDGPH